MAIFAKYLSYKINKFKRHISCILQTISYECGVLNNAGFFDAILYKTSLNVALFLSFADESSFFGHGARFRLILLE